MARNMRMSIALDPEMYMHIKECAAELGVPASAWAAMRLGEAARNQQKVGRVMESMGLNLATLMLDAGVADDETT